MDRRKFLSWMLLAPALPVAAKFIEAFPPPAPVPVAFEPIKFDFPAFPEGTYDKIIEEVRRTLAASLHKNIGGNINTKELTTLVHKDLKELQAREVINHYSFAVTKTAPGEAEVNVTFQPDFALQYIAVGILS